MLHDVKDEGTRPPGLPTVKGTFPGHHVIFVILENSAQIDPHSLDRVRTSVTPGSSEVGGKGNCPLACRGPLYGDCRAWGMSRIG